MGIEINMGNHKGMLERRISKKISWLSFKELENYFSNPDSKILNLSAISSRQFIKDLDSVINFSKKEVDISGNIGRFSTSIDYSTTKKTNQSYFINSVQKCKNFKLHKVRSKLFNFFRGRHTRTKVFIESWNFSDFDDAETFQVGKLYQIKPVSINYKAAKQDYKYDKQIISKFRIEETNGNIKDLLLIDTIKDEKLKREKYIDGQKINRQHYNFEIRSHRLNRGLMKTFLFHRINKCRRSEYDGSNNFLYANQLVIMPLSVANSF